MLQTPVETKDVESEGDCDEDDDDEGEEQEDYNDGNESAEGDQKGQFDDGIMSSFLSKSEMSALESVMYPMSKNSDQLGSSFHAKQCPDSVRLDPILLFFTC